MATSITAVKPVWADGVTFSAKVLRQAGGSAWYPAVGGSGPIVVASGVHPGNGGTTLKVSPSSGMQISIAAGFASIQGTETADQGVYTTGLAAAGTLDVPTSHPTLPRYDLVVAYVDDNGDNSTQGYIAVISGTAAGSPADPTPPANAVRLARVIVGASDSSVGAGDIVDLRAYTVPVGGILPTTSDVSPTAPFIGQVKLDVDTYTARFFDGSSWVQFGARHAPRGVVAFGYNTVNSAAWNSTAEVTVQTLSTVPMVSGRRYKIISSVQVGNAGGVNAADDFVVLHHKVDGTPKSQFSFITSIAVAGLAPDCSTYTTFLDDATSGTHTVSLTGANLAGTGSHQIIASNPAARAFIMVEDVGALV